MGPARQILRWAIPGWLIFLFFFFAVMVRFILAGKVLTITDFAAHNYVGLLSLVTAAAGLGIPIGFLLYQVYYWLYWRIPIPFKTPRDRGHDILKDIPVHWRAWVGYDLDADAHLSTGKTILALGRFALRIRTHDLLKRYQHNWVLAENVWDILLWRHNARWLDARAEVLSDTYHSLGTGLISLVLGYVAYLLYDLMMHRTLILVGDLSYFSGALVNLLILGVLVTIFRFTRADTLRSLVAYKHDLIAYFCSLPETETPADTHTSPAPIVSGITAPDDRNHN